MVYSRKLRERWHYLCVSFNDFFRHSSIQTYAALTKQRESIPWKRINVDQAAGFKLEASTMEDRVNGNRKCTFFRTLCSHLGLLQ